MKTYNISFTLTQRGAYLSWVEMLLRAGLREGEKLEHLKITEVSDRINEDINKSKQLDLFM